jgi:hypothetical protein
VSEDHAVDILRDILARPEFRWDDNRGWWDQVLVSLAQLLIDTWGRLSELVRNAASGQEGWWGLGVLLLAAAIVLLGLLYLGRSVRLAVLGESRVRAESLAERRERSDRLWQSAQELASRGQLDEAVRVVYLSGLYALDEHALIHVHRGLTNREHAGQLRRDHPLVGETFSAVVERYDRLRYGHTAVTPDFFAELSVLVARTRAASIGGDLRLPSQLEASEQAAGR